MSHSPPDDRPHPYPRHVAVVGAAGGLGQGILTVCRDEGVGFTAIVRSRPERITNVPSGSRVAVVPSLADRSALSAAFAGADAVLTALGVTATSQDPSASLAANMESVERSMIDAGVDRVVVIQCSTAHGIRLLYSRQTGHRCDLESEGQFHRYRPSTAM